MVNTGVNFYKYISPKKIERKSKSVPNKEKSPKKMKFKTKTSAYAFDEDLMKANGECSFSIQKNPF